MFIELKVFNKPCDKLVGKYNRKKKV